MPGRAPAVLQAAAWSTIILMVQTNWAGNYTYRAAACHAPRTRDELLEIAARSRRLKVIGTRHTFNGVTDTDGDHISLEHFSQTEPVDVQSASVAIRGGVTYAELSARLHAQGYALPNLASLPHISVAGAVATATHGSGDTLGNLATSVRALELVTTTGEVIQLSRDRDGERFCGAVVSLGALGIVTRLVLDVVPAFDVRQYVYEELPFANVGGQLSAITSAAYSVSLFTDWRAPRFTQVWLKQRVDASPSPAPSFHGATLARVDRHPIVEISAESCTPQLGVAGPWHERLAHFRIGHTPSAGDEVQSEYYVPRIHGEAMIATVASLSNEIGPLVQASEIRTIAADDLWLSPCRGQACIAVHFTWRNDLAAVRTVLPRLEAALEPFGAMPHWGKQFTTSRDRLRTLFPRLPAFRALANELDPEGKLRNAYLDEYVF